MTIDKPASGPLYLLTFVATVIAFLIWIHRTSKNLAALGWQNQRFSPVEALVWWFVPILWLFMPYRVMKEIWKGSLRSQRTSEFATSDKLPITPLLGPWWAAWLLSAFVGAYSVVLNFSDASTTSDLIAANYAAVVSDLFSLSALALITTLMWQITTNQENLHLSRTQDKAEIRWGDT